MHIFSFLILIAYLFFFFLSRNILSRNEVVFANKKLPFVYFPFYKMAVYIYQRFIAGKRKEKTGNSNRLLGSEKISAGLRILFPGQESDKALLRYYFGKLALVLLVVFTGSLLSFLLSFRQEGILGEGNGIRRGTYGEREKEITIQVTGQRKESKGALKVKVASRQYTEEELENLYKQFLPILEKEIMGCNTNKNKIQEDMNLQTKFASFPFTVEWRTSNPALMNYEGIIQENEIKKEGELLELTALITYGDFRKIYTGFIRIYPPSLTDTEQFLKTAAQELQKSDEESRFQQEWRLPEEVAGEPVIWEDKTPPKSTLILGMSCLAAALIYFQKDYDLKKKVKKREQEMLWDYPVIVSRLTLYLNAGMTVKTAWKKAAGAGKKTERERYIYKEMLLACYEMDSGIPEVNAYERFGKRCALQPYIKLTALLTQNVKKGNRVLLERLKEETQLALLERKNKVRISAEEAGTKLLLPMMLMMAVVMILIMVPALRSF